MIENWQIKFIDRPGRMGREMYIFRKGIEENEFIVFPKEYNLETIKKGDVAPVGLYFTDDMFQQLVDAIHKDFKPSEGKFTEGKLEAQTEHLKDLKKLLKL